MKKFFGVDKKEALRRMKEPPLDSGRVQYMGGHKAFPSPIWSEVYFYEDRFVLEAINISVPYSKIRDIGNSNEKKRDLDRLVIGGLIGYAFKKNHIYTIVEYDDGLDVQKIVIDFERNVNYAQALIYKKMLEYRNTEKSQLEKEPQKLERGSTSSGSPIK